MATDTTDERIRVSDRVKRHLDRRRRDDESYNDVSERGLGETGDSDDGVGSWSSRTAERVRTERERAAKRRKTQTGRRTKVLDASVLVDYLGGEDATKESYEADGGPSGRWVIPTPAYAEVLVGAGPDRDVGTSHRALGWAETYALDHETAVLAGETRLGRRARFSRPDALVAAVGGRQSRPRTVISHTTSDRRRDYRQVDST